jgi:hypothetical protein
MTIAPPVVKCPVCEAHGEILHHDIRASLIYSCRNCSHEWQIDPEEEPEQTESKVPAERPQTSSRARKPQLRRL